MQITTINGAKVLDEKKDIQIPQGVAHAVDRVMFPLPVGDILQTLQSDRERRFTNLLRALFASGLAESLQGKKKVRLTDAIKKLLCLETSDRFGLHMHEAVFAETANQADCKNNSAILPIHRELIELPFIKSRLLFNHSSGSIVRYEIAKQSLSASFPAWPLRY